MQADMDQPHPQMDITFGCAWWHHHYGMAFGEEAWRDPIARTERERQQRRLLFERLGDVGLGEEDPRPRPDIEAYGHRFMSALWGCEIEYVPDQAPGAYVLPGAGMRMGDLEVPDLDTSPVVRRALEDARLLNECYGCCSGHINFGGPLNNAVSVLGEEILEACLTAPERAQRVLRKMGEAILAVHDGVTCRIDGADLRSGRPQAGIGNCPVCMISPETYRSVVLPVDRWYSRQYRECRLHHCGLFHPYAEAYRALRPVAVDVGWGSDLRITRQAFPRTPMSLEIQAAAVIGKDAQDLDEMVGEMLRGAAPVELVTRLWVAEAGVEVSDDAVRALMTVPERRWGAT